MKRQIYLLIFITCTILCCKNLKTSPKSTIKMETFDLEYFKANQKNGTVDTTLSDGTYIVMLGLDDSYIKEVRPSKSSPYCTSYFFARSSLKLSQVLTTFFKCPTGIMKKFDENGNIIETRDFDALYKFSIDDLIKKIHTEFGVDLTNVNQHVEVSRGVDTKIENLGYSIMIFLTGRSYRYIVVDGKTGEIKKNVIAETIE